MNSIRPLVTITILIVVGAFLYVKINQGPVRALPGAAVGGQESMPEGVPPLGLPTLNTAAAPSATNTASAGAAIQPSAAAPPAARVAEPPSGPISQNASQGATAAAPPEVPAMPDLPGLPPPTEIRSATTPLTTSPPVELPAHIPTARYPDDPPANEAAGPAPGAASQPLAAAAATAAGEQDGAAENAMRAMGLTPAASGMPDSAGVAATGRSDPAPAGAAAPVDRYGLPITSSAGGSTAAAAAGTGASSANTSTSPTAAFSAAWPAIQASLARNELAQAHKLLSPWYGHPALAPAEAEQVGKLLGQLAGTVVYSTEHRLEPPYTVRSGETLETIAMQHDVPWQLLAKINGIPAPNQVRPGQQLKVVRGPFSAVVDLRRNQLTLMVQGLYAGRFAASPLGGAMVPEGDWIVSQKEAVPATRTVYGAEPRAQAAGKLILRDAAARPDIPSGSVVIGSKEAIDVRPGPQTQTVSYPLAVSPADAVELCDILSIGSRVTIRR
jgi:LysM repeat protein